MIHTEAVEKSVDLQTFCQCLITVYKDVKGATLKIHVELLILTIRNFILDHFL
jgi:hypothetical protein